MKKSNKYHYKSKMNLIWFRGQEEGLSNCINYAFKKNNGK